MCSFGDEKAPLPALAESGADLVGATLLSAYMAPQEALVVWPEQISLLTIRSPATVAPHLEQVVAGRVLLLVESDHCQFPNLSVDQATRCVFRQLHVPSYAICCAVSSEITRLCQVPS